MAAGATVTGLAEARRGVALLTETVQARLQAVALDTATRGRDRAWDLCAKDSGITADSIAVFPELDQKQYRVEVGPSPRAGRTATLPNLPIWIERGTIHQPARPFMRPAAEEQQDRYIREMKAAALDGLAEALG